jgi:sortase A
MKPDSIRKHLQTWRVPMQRVARYLFVLGLAALIYAGYVFVNARRYQAHEENLFAAARSMNTEVTAEPPLPIEGQTMGEMEVSRLGLKVAIAQGDTPEILERAVGHLPGTPLPGETGNVALAGHRDTFFRPLKDIVLGDAITLKTLGGDFQYIVESTTVVPPTAVEVIQSSGGHVLTLVTCFPFYYVGSAPDRFIVRARQVETWP